MCTAKKDTVHDDRNLHNTVIASLFACVSNIWGNGHNWASANGQLTSLYQTNKPLACNKSNQGQAAHVSVAKKPWEKPSGSQYENVLFF